MEKARVDELLESNKIKNKDLKEVVKKHQDYEKEKMNIQDKIQEIHHKYGATEIANYKIQLFIDELIKSEKKQLRLQIVNQQRELLINLLSSLENGGGRFFINKEQIVDDYLKAN